MNDPDGDYAGLMKVSSADGFARWTTQEGCDSLTNANVSVTELQKKISDLEKDNRELRNKITAQEEGGILEVGVREEQHNKKLRDKLGAQGCIKDDYDTDGNLVAGVPLEEPPTESAPCRPVSSASGMNGSIHNRIDDIDVTLKDMQISFSELHGEVRSLRTGTERNSMCYLCAIC